MNRIFIIVVGFLFFGHFAFGQTPFNYKRDFQDILARTRNSADSLYYNKLLKRFNVNDTTLTNYEVLSLLIGFTDKPDYKPYSDASIERDISVLNREGKFQEALDDANVFLKTHPVNVRVLSEKTYSFQELRQKDSTQYYAHKVIRIFEAMYFSGDGRSEDTPAFALGPADGQSFINHFVGASIGLMGSKRDRNGDFLDMLEAEFGDGKSIQLYFIIQHATDKMFDGSDVGKKVKRSTNKSKREKRPIE